MVSGMVKKICMILFIILMIIVLTYFCASLMISFAFN